MTEREWLARLEWFGIKLGLDTIGELTAALGHPERAYPVVHVAGTNGKGSVVAMIERVENRAYVVETELDAELLEAEKVFEGVHACGTG